MELLTFVVYHVETVLLVMTIVVFLTGITQLVQVVWMLLLVTLTWMQRFLISHSAITVAKVA